MIHPVILCGGSGTRLWPYSRSQRPKPFLPVVGRDTMLDATLQRCSSRKLYHPPIIVGGRRHRELLADATGDYEDVSIIIEPEGRNTAPAIALAALQLPEDAIMLVCPSDHHIGDEVAFRAAVEAAAALAREDWLVTFGIEATRPETGYGYLKKGVALGSGFRVAEFVEKPDRERARAYLDDGGYSWNGGLFCFRAGCFLDELERYRPDMISAIRQSVARGRDEDGIFLPDADAFAGIEGESVDYAVMENTDRAAMVAASMEWSDIGDWNAVRTAREKDENGNAIRGKADLVECRNVIVQSDGPRVSAIGLENVIVVVDGDQVLVIDADEAQRVGKLPGVTKT
ncbi:mannose-1-phosphate guanylyltransferase [Qipengyuania sp. JC766]|uniref:mannose-1-phosphate guanylyltransferase n=1 Tax=Qipengyuania sp. JC766 TaxID=3232139 RepID=UPI003458F169